MYEVRFTMYDYFAIYLHQLFIHLRARFASGERFSLFAILYICYHEKGIDNKWP